jgi:predicted sulfurtransferase
MWQVGEPYKVILWYRYCPISDVATLIETLTIKCKSLHLLGRILLSIEGMNGTLAGSCEDIDHFINYLSDDLNFHHIDWKFHIEYQHCDYLPFLQLSIREVQEIISCGLQRQFINNFIQYDSMSYGGIEGSGIHLSPEEFHHMIEKEKPENCLILDIRNEFEYDIGHFNNAIGIGTFTYAETFKVLDEVLADEMAKAAAGVKRVQHTDDNANSIEKSDTSIVANDGKTIDECAVEEKSINEKSTNDKKILMYCTGGIRCEKASAYLRAKGLDNVYQLQGGIHRYLEHYPDGGKFLGKNFVFDSRVAVSGEHAAGSNPDQQQHQLDGSYSLGGSSVVVGKCIDCKASHDTYSGFIVCTVCRMPVLVCPNCVENNPYPGEYYCSRHRYAFKLGYVNVVTIFSILFSL